MRDEFYIVCEEDQETAVREIGKSSAGVMQQIEKALHEERKKEQELTKRNRSGS